MNLSQNDILSCPDCHAQFRIKGSQSYALVCTSCGQVVSNENDEPISASRMPEDWSPVKIGTKGFYKDRSFEVIGRIRLQLQQGYKNYWCLWLAGEKKYGWLAESLGEYMVCDGSFFELDDPASISFTAGEKLVLPGEARVSVDYIDKCEKVDAEGEVARWPFYRDGFQTVQSQNNSAIAAHFFIRHEVKMLRFLVGETVDYAILNLQEIRTWDEWK